MTRPMAGRAGRLAALAVLTAGLWWGWFAWDDQYRRDPASGGVSGPYALWQGIGCAACWVVLAVVAERFLRPWILLTVMPLSFTAAYALTVIPPDRSGLAGIGVILVGLGTCLGTLVVTGATREVRGRIDRRGRAR